MRLGDLLKGAEAEGKEKHVPVIEVSKGCGGEDGAAVTVVVGKEVPHPNTPEHYIVWMELFGVKKSGQVVTLGRAEFTGGYTAPNVKFHLPLGEFKAFCALSYCNIHGLWQNCLEVQ